MNSPKHTNQLVNETSPYLLQHAHNPVNWIPWSRDVFTLATKQDKLVLISIGYSACHWCHVMEHESFENEEVAMLMNKHFICVKIDREEHPDIDSIYMTAVQLMTHQGGWPLNCFTLPDGRPVYGGTYFPRQNWMEVLRSLTDVYENDRPKVLEYASRLTDAIRQGALVTLKNAPQEFETRKLLATVTSWKSSFDNQEGGPQRAPKFPLPVNYEFLLQWSHLKGDAEVAGHVHLTLSKMALGGIYDQVGGGFARYSVDERWKVPHFEKMLYDNAQLIALYAKAWLVKKDELYRQVVMQTISFIRRELTSPQGAFYSALDADSEGVEGKFYTWSEDELIAALTAEELTFARAYFNVNDEGYWEDGRYILLRKVDDVTFARQQDLTVAEVRQRAADISARLLQARSARIRPGLDDKILTSWNAMMVSALAVAYRTFRNPEDLKSAEVAARFMLDQLRRPDGGLWHTHKNGFSRINGYLEDYCFAIGAFTELYAATFNEEWLRHALELTEYCIEKFSDDNALFFYFTSKDEPELISRKTETQDNVIPAANSVMAHNLFRLGFYFYREDLLQRSKKMVAEMQEEMLAYGPGYSNWLSLYLHFSEPFHEIVIAGPRALENASPLQQMYLPNALVATGEGAGSLPMLQNRVVEGKTLIYVCHERYCEKPAESLNEIFPLITPKPSGK